MNKNLVNYPIRFGTLLLTGAALVACSKTTFTEDDALRLETKRLRVTREIDSLSRVQAAADRKALLEWQNAVDQLEKANAGGKVFYTVIPVRGTDAVFTPGGNTQGGRTENAIPATVTVTQYGRSITSGLLVLPGTTPPTGGIGGVASGSTAVNNVHTFGDLRSGEITVSITSPNMTEVNYVANLTPDGGVANNATVYVGNVIPLFEIATTAANMATIKGNVYYEGDLTNDREEPLTNEIFNGGTGVGAAPIATAAIDVTRAGSENGLPYFHQRFLSESNGEGVNSFGTPVRSGAIQRIAYSGSGNGVSGVARAPLTAGNEAGMVVSKYSMLVPSTAGGLPIQLRYAEFADYRTYYNDLGQLIPKTAPAANVVGPRPERFLYGPTVTPDPVPVGVSRPMISIQAFITQATASGTFTPQVNGAFTDNFDSPANGTMGTTTINGTALTLAGGALANAGQVVVPGSGLYLTTPTVTISGTNTTATFSAINGTAAFTTSLGAAPVPNPPSDWAMWNVAGINLLTAGSGYTTNSIPLIFTRTDFVDQIGFGGQFSPSGTTGSGGLVPINMFAQVIDGGATFNPSAAIAGGLTSPAVFTNYLPTVVFTETDQPTSADPSRGYNTPGVVITPASARVFVDYNATYNGTNGNPNNNGITGIGAAAGGGVGAIQEVRVLSAGSYPSGSLPFINFSFGETVSTSGFVAGTNKNLFVASGTQSVVQFNTTLTAAELSGLFTGAGTGITVTANKIDFTAGNGWGSRYTFVPTVQVTPNSSAAGKLGATTTGNVQSVPVICAVDNRPTLAGPVVNPQFGKILSIQLTSTPINGLSFPAGFVAGTDFLVSNAGTPAFSTTAGTDVFGINVIPNRYGNTLRAFGQPGGSRTQNIGTGINSYSYNSANNGAILANFSTLSTAANGIASNTMDVANPAEVPIIGTTATGVATTTGYLFGNEMLVAFSAPNVTGAVANRFAWGVPVLNNATNGSVILGARILDAGSGYNAPVVSAGNFTSVISSMVIPNPWFRSNRIVVRDINGANPVNVDGPLGIPAANANLKSIGAITTDLLANDVWGFLKAIGTASATVSRSRTASIPAYIDFTITSGGEGYAKAPDALVFGGNLDLTTYNGTSTSPGGLINLGAVRTATVGTVLGTVTKLNPTLPTTVTNPLTGAAVPNPLGSPAQLPGGRWIFAVGTAPAYGIAGTVLQVRIIDRLSEALTNQTNNGTGNGGVGATAIITPTTADTKVGEVSAVTFGRTGPLTGPGATAAGTDVIAGAAYIGNYSQIDQGAAGTAPTFNYPVLPAFFEKPILTTGTPAVGAAIVEVDINSGLNRHRRIFRIVTTATDLAAIVGPSAVTPRNAVTPGSGYSLGNRWQRLDRGVPTYQASQAFTVVGGFEMGGNNGGNTMYNYSNQDNVRFDAFTGMTYVRDLHYGTGHRLD